MTTTLPSAAPAGEPPAGTAPARPRPGLFVLIAISAIAMAGMNIFLPSMPGLQQVFETDYATAQMTLTLYLLALAVGQLVIGPISDRYGRRPVVLAGTAAYIIASFGCMLAQSIETLLAWRLVQAAGGCAGLALSRAMVRDLYERTKGASMLGYITMAWVTVQVISPSVGGIVDEWAGWRANFAVTATLGASVLALAWFKLHETLHVRAKTFGAASLARNSAALLKSPVFIGYAFNAAFASGTFLAFAAGAPYIAMDLMGLSPAQYGLWVILSTGGFMFGNFLSGRLAVRAGAHGLIFAGNAFTLLGLALIIYLMAQGIREPLAIFGPQAIIGIANGLTVPSALAGAFAVNPRVAGAAAGLTGFLQMSAGVIGTALVSLLHDGTTFPMIAAMTASGLISISFFYVALLSQRRG